MRQGSHDPYLTTNVFKGCLNHEFTIVNTLLNSKKYQRTVSKAYIHSLRETLSSTKEGPPVS